MAGRFQGSTVLLCHSVPATSFRPLWADSLSEILTRFETPTRLHSRAVNASMATGHCYRTDIDFGFHSWLMSERSDGGEAESIAASKGRGDRASATVAWEVRRWRGFVVIGPQPSGKSGGGKCGFRKSPGLSCLWVLAW